MSGKTNKWGPALTGSTDGQQAGMRPTDIAAAIAAGLSIKLAPQANSVLVNPPGTVLSAEFEINDSPQLNSFTGVSVKLRGVFKQSGTADLHPMEKKLHLFVQAGSPDALQKALAILRHCSATGLLMANPHQIYNACDPHRLSPAIAPTLLFPQQQQVHYASHPTQSFTVPSFSQLVPQHYQRQQLIPQDSQLLQISPIDVLDLQQKLFQYCGRVSLGALAGPNVGHPGFSVKGRILGPQGQNVKHITTVTGVKVQLRGRGASQNPEADGPEHMYLELNASSEHSLHQAVELASNLVETVRLEYVASVTQPLRPQVPNNSYNQMNLYLPVPPPYYSAPQLPPFLDINTSRSHLPVGMPVAPKSQSTPYSSAGPQATMPPMLLPHTMNRNSSQMPGMASGQGKGCVPFVYPDGDAVIKAPNTQQGPNKGVTSVLQTTSLNAQQRSVGSSSREVTRLSLNGSTFAVSSVPKEASSASSWSNSSSSSDRHKESRSANDDCRHSSSGSNKRRRGFQESSVYTAPTECPLPKSIVRESHSVKSIEVSRVVNVASVDGHARGESTANESSHQRAAPHTEKGPVSVSLVSSDSSGGYSMGGSSEPVEVAEPSAPVMAALAAMTQRRLQAKMSRPLVPTFGDKQPVPLFSDKPSVPAFSEKPCVPLFGDSLPSKGTLSTDGMSRDATPVANHFKLPGLTAYDDDEDDD